MNNPTHLAIPSNFFVKETDKAYCFKLDDGRFIPLPKSKIRDFQQINDYYDFWIDGWLIEQNNIEEFIDTSYAPSLFN